MGNNGTGVPVDGEEQSHEREDVRDAENWDLVIISRNELFQQN